MDTERFANRLQALSWLKAQGYKVSKSKLYDDVRDGILPVNTDGTVSRFRVMQYGQQLDLAQRSQDQFNTSGEREALELRKLKAEVEEKEQKARREDARWMLKADAWAAVAALLTTIKDNIRHQLHEGQGLLVQMCKGEQEYAPQVFEAALDLVEQGLDEVAGQRISGIFEDMADDETDEDTSEGLLDEQ